MKKEKNSKKDLNAVSAAQFKRLQTRVKNLENWREGAAAPPVPVGTEDIPETILASGTLNRFRGFVKRNPIFWTAGCLMVGYVFGCIICDFSTFGGY